MAEIIPFKPEPKTAEEKNLKSLLEKNPNDFETLWKLIVLKFRQGRFNSDSWYAKRFLKVIPQTDTDKIDNFLINITEIVEKSKSEIHHPKGLPSNIINFFREITDQNDNYVRVLKEISEIFFGKEEFIKGLRRIAHLGTDDLSDDENREVKADLPYLKEVFKVIIEKHGMLKGLAYLQTFSFKEIIPVKQIDDTLKSLPRKQLEEINRKRKYNLKNTFLLILAEELLTEIYNQEKADFKQLYQLFALRYVLEKPFDDVCNSIIGVIPESSKEQISSAFSSGVNFWVEDDEFREWSDIETELLLGHEEVEYEREMNRTPGNFMEDIYATLEKFEKHYENIGFWASRYHDNYWKECPPKILTAGLIERIFSLHYAAEEDEIEQIVHGFFDAGRGLVEQGYYDEAIICCKTGLFYALLLSRPGDNPVREVDLNLFSDITSKRGSFKDSIEFLSKFRFISEHAFPIHQGYLNEIEISKRQLEYEYKTNNYHKVERFYELVAKNEIPAIKNHIHQLDNDSKIELTKEEFEILLHKIAEKSSVIQGLKSVSAKCDMIMNMNVQMHEKQSAIFDAVIDNKRLLNVIEKKTDNIIENMHFQNMEHLSAVDATAIEKYYEDKLTVDLWRQLHNDTKKCLMLAEHLYDMNRFSTYNEFGFIAIEYSKGIENEILEKIINNYLTMKKIESIKYKDEGKLVVISSKTTLGTIPYLIRRLDFLSDIDQQLKEFKEFIEKSLIGKKSLFRFKENLFLVVREYRNPAAHPSNYPREKIDAFRRLLFDEGFLKSFLHAIQPAHL